MPNRDNLREEMFILATSFIVIHSVVGKARQWGMRWWMVT